MFYCFKYLLTRPRPLTSPRIRFLIEIEFQTAEPPHVFQTFFFFFFFFFPLGFIPLNVFPPFFFFFKMFYCFKYLLTRPRPLTSPRIRFLIEIEFQTAKPGPTSFNLAFFFFFFFPIGCNPLYVFPHMFFFFKMFYCFKYLLTVDC